MIIGHGLFVFRDPNGIRPLVIGKHTLADGGNEYILASESVAPDTLGFDFLRDITPVQAVYVTEKGQLFTRQGAETLGITLVCSSISISPGRTRSSTKSRSTAPAGAWAKC